MSAAQVMVPAGTFVKEHLPQLWRGSLTAWEAFYTKWQKRPLAEVLPAESQAALAEHLSAQLRR